MDRGGRPHPSVLIVDDDTANLDVVREALESEGVAVAGVAPDGATGVRMSAELQPDVVLMDLRMPGMDGFEATAAIRARDHWIQVVILTAYEELLSRSADEVGAFAYLVKGCSTDLMVSVVDQAWRRSAELRRMATSNS